MKNTIIIAVALIIAAVTGCSDRPAKAQALLLDAISFADGGSTGQAQGKALNIAAEKGRVFVRKIGSPSQDEMVMQVGSEVCDQIIAKYPETPTAIKAAELKRQIDQKIETMRRIRIQSTFRDPDDWMK